jgi:rare lipoprotein A
MRSAHCRSPLSRLLAAGCAIWLALGVGCTSTRPAASRTPGDRASPAGDDTAQTLRGTASWYGARHHGRRTASGERFDKNAYTAAHRTLRFGTRVRVINERNGRQVVVRINDRGPFGKRTRIIDLSEAAARALRMLDAGVVPVTLHVLRGRR